MRVLAWHVHGSWMTSFVQGRHDHLVPVTPDRGPDGLGRARTYPWPDTVTEVTPEQLRDAELDLVVLQRPHEIELCERWTGRRPATCRTSRCCCTTTTSTAWTMSCSPSWN